MRDLWDTHVHSSLSDGSAAPEEMAARAAEMGLRGICITDHSYVSCEPDYGIRPDEDYEAYRRELERVRNMYRGRLEVISGIEQDSFSELPDRRFSYVIGSVHYVRVGERYFSVDLSPEEILAGAEALQGDILDFCEAYYRELALVPAKTHADTVGHFDLIAKLNGDGILFDEASPRYIRAWQKAADELLASGCLFEINTSALCRGLRKAAYPAPPIYAYLRERGARFVLAGDAHSPEQLAGEFEKLTELYPGLEERLVSLPEMLPRFGD